VLPPLSSYFRFSFPSFGSSFSRCLLSCFMQSCAGFFLSVVPFPRTTNCLCCLSQ
jgi:hypothetical protein